MANTYEAAVGGLSAFSAKTREEYTAWEKRHAEMVKTPPTEGKQYLNHAMNIIRLFEGLGELHPVAKTVVATFKSVVLYEQDRRENNARVQCVLLAQTDMMQVFIQLEQLNKRSHISNEADEILDENAEALEEVGRDIQQDIKKCGNSFDTYYNERKIVKFLKSNDWKLHMNGLVDIFTGHKRRVQTLLAFRTQRGIDDLNAKMGILLNTLFKATDEEQNVLKLARKPGGLDDARIEKLLTLTDDTSIRPTHETITGAKTPASKAEDEGRKLAILNDIRDELNTPLDELCLRNEPYFQQKLDFHTEQLKEAITSSARDVIRALQGPHDRLVHEDLRELWKEMHWIFCVDTRQFLLALQEYYVERFLKNNRGITNPPEGTELVHESDAGIQDRSHTPHPDAWTLQYLNTIEYFDRIRRAIDKDNSGFIRISEANDFTAGMPASWSLPQWCTYHATGWICEDKIYQSRIRTLLVQLSETQATALPSNRGYILRTLDYTAGWFFPLSTGRGDGTNMEYPSELLSLVHSKVLRQDEYYRKALGRFKKLGVNDSAIELVFRDKDVETYILILVTLLLEEWLNVFQACLSEILDVREFDRIEATVNIVTDLVETRIESIQEASGAAKSQSTLLDFRGGIFYNYSQDILDVSQGDITRHILEDARLLDGLPSDAFLTDEPPALGYSTVTGPVPHDESRMEYPFPHHAITSCDDCGRFPISEMHRYLCMECSNKDFCSPCWHSGTTKTTGHKHDHRVFRMDLTISAYLRPWMKALGEDEITYILFLMCKDDQHGLLCTRCKAPFNSQSKLHACVMHECQGDVRLCENCAEYDYSHRDDDDGDDNLQGDVVEHKSWHTMLVVRYQYLSDRLAEEDSEGEQEAPTTAVQDTVSQVETTDSRIQNLENRVVALESEIRISNKEMKDMISQLLGKMTSGEAAGIGNAARSTARSGVTPTVPGLGSSTVIATPSTRAISRNLVTEHSTQVSHSQEEGEGHEGGGGHEEGEGGEEGEDREEGGGHEENEGRHEGEEEYRGAGGYEGGYEERGGNEEDEGEGEEYRGARGYDGGGGYGQDDEEGYGDANDDYGD